MKCIKSHSVVLPLQWIITTVKKDFGSCAWWFLSLYHLHKSWQWLNIHSSIFTVYVSLFGQQYPAVSSLSMWWLTMSCSQWVTRDVASNSVWISPLAPTPLRVNVIALLIVRNQILGSYLQLKKKKQFWIKIVKGLKKPHRAVLLQMCKARVAAALVIVLCPSHTSRVDLKAKEQGRNIARGLLRFSGGAAVPPRAALGSYFHMLSSSYLLHHVLKMQRALDLLLLLAQIPVFLLCQNLQSSCRIRR